MNLKMSITSPLKFPPILVLWDHFQTCQLPDEGHTHAREIQFSSVLYWASSSRAQIKTYVTTITHNGWNVSQRGWTWLPEIYLALTLRTWRWKIHISSWNSPDLSSVRAQAPGWHHGWSCVVVSSCLPGSAEVGCTCVSPSGRSHRWLPSSAYSSCPAWQPPPHWVIPCSSS